MASRSAEVKITIEQHNDQFNVALSSKEGVEPFLTIKGCRVVNGRNGDFVSWPARKLDSGKYWNHVYASEAFGAAVLEAVAAQAPKKPAARKPVEDDSSVPF
jgi:DNA-binding cell septation regulator SpoVG